VSCTKAIEEAVKRRDYIDYGETDFGVHALVPEARVFDKVLGLREVYTVWARLNLGVLEGDDPAAKYGALGLASSVAVALCGPRSSTYKYSCETATPCGYGVSCSQGVSAIDFANCIFTTRCAPMFFVMNAGPDSSGLLSDTAIQAFAPPLDPGTVSQCSYSSTKQMSDLLYLCRYSFDDTTNNRGVVTFSTWDKRNTSYSFTHATIGYKDGTTLGAYFYYPFNTTYTKSSTDIYRYLYDIAVGYQ